MNIPSSKLSKELQKSGQASERAPNNKSNASSSTAPSASRIYAGQHEELLTRKYKGKAKVKETEIESAPQQGSEKTDRLSAQNNELRMTLSKTVPPATTKQTKAFSQIDQRNDEAGSSTAHGSTIAGVVSARAGSSFDTRRKSRITNELATKIQSFYNKIFHVTPRISGGGHQDLRELIANFKHLTKNTAQYVANISDDGTPITTILGTEHLVNNGTDHNGRKIALHELITNCINFASNELAFNVEQGRAMELALRITKDPACDLFRMLSTNYLLSHINNANEQFLDELIKSTPGSSEGPLDYRAGAGSNNFIHFVYEVMNGKSAVDQQEKMTDVQKYFIKLIERANENNNDPLSQLVLDESNSLTGNSSNSTALSHKKEKTSRLTKLLEKASNLSILPRQKAQSSQLVAAGVDVPRPKAQSSQLAAAGVDVQKFLQNLLELQKVLGNQPQKLAIER